MAKLIYILFSFVLLFAFIACQGEKAAEETQTEAEVTVEKTVDENMAECANACGMAEEKEKMIAHEEDGDTIYFCSEKCQDEYLAQDVDENEEAEDTEDES